MFAHIIWEHVLYVWFKCNSIGKLQFYFYICTCVSALMKLLLDYIISSLLHFFFTYYLETIALHKEEVNRLLMSVSNLLQSFWMYLFKQAKIWGLVLYEQVTLTQLSLNIVFFINIVWSPFLSFHLYLIILLVL